MIDVLTGMAQAVAKTGQDVQGLASLEGNWVSLAAESYAYDSALHNVLTHKVRGGSMGANGNVVLLLGVGLRNDDNGAGNTQINPITFSFGGTTLFSFALTPLGAASNRRSNWFYLLSVSNRVSQAEQEASLYMIDSPPQLSATTVTATTPYKGFNEAFADTSQDQDLLVNITAAGTDPDRSMRRLWAWLLVTYGE